MNKKTNYEKATFVGDSALGILAAIRAEVEKARNAKSGYWIEGRS